MLRIRSMQVVSTVTMTQAAVIASQYKNGSATTLRCVDDVASHVTDSETTKLKPAVNLATKLRGVRRTLSTVISAISY